MVESVEGGLGHGGAPPTVEGLAVTPTPHLAGLGPPVGVEAEDAGGQDAELEEDDCSTWSRCGR